MFSITSTAKVDKRTKRLALRIKKGEIAVINHADLDSTCARMLVECKAGAVINAVKSISGRYPNTGPSILLDAGIPVIDDAGIDVMADIVEGDEIHIDGGSVRRGGEVLATGTFLTPKLVRDQMEASRSNLVNELEKFAQNTLHYIQEEKSLILDPFEVPELRTKISGKHALIVVRGEGFREDLASLSRIY